LGKFNFNIGQKPQSHIKDGSNEKTKDESCLTKNSVIEKFRKKQDQGIKQKIQDN